MASLLSSPQGDLQDGERGSGWLICNLLRNVFPHRWDISVLYILPSDMGVLLFPIMNIVVRSGSFDVAFAQVSHSFSMPLEQNTLSALAVETSLIGFILITNIVI